MADEGHDRGVGHADTLRFRKAAVIAAAAFSACDRWVHLVDFRYSLPASSRHAVQ